MEILLDPRIWASLLTLTVRGYLYFAIAFSAFVEFLNLRAAKRRRKKEPLPVRTPH